MKSAKKYSFWGNLKFSISYLWKWGKQFVLITIIITIIPIVQNVFSMYILSLSINEFANYSNAAYVYIILLFCGNLVANIIIGFMNQKTLPSKQTLHLKFQKLLYQKNMDTDYENVENPEKNNEFNLAYQDTLNGCAPVKIINQIISLFAVLIGLCIYSLSITYVSVFLLAAVFFSAFLSYVLNVQLQKYIEKNKEQKSELDRKEAYISSISAKPEYAKDIRMFNMKTLLLPELSAIHSLQIAWENRIEKRKFIVVMILSLVSLAQQGLMYYYVMSHISLGNLTPGLFVFYTNSIIMLSSYISSVFNIITNIYRSSIKVEYYRKYLDMGNINSYTTTVQADYKKDGLIIEFDHVSFRYPNADIDILHNISFKINCNEKVAVVGLNGAGKTTLIKLLCGLYVPTSGVIRVNGVSSKEINIHNYYELFAPVFQDIHLLPITIEEFIKSNFDYKKVTDKKDEYKLMEAIELSGLREKICSLPRGVQTKLMKGIYEDGIDLSGGEKQKLMMARAIYKDSPCIVLDEPTSAMDPIAEQELYAKYNTIFTEKSIVFVSHRMSSTKFCDKIILLENGSIAEYGTYEELLYRKGRFSEIYETQKKYYT